MSHAIADPNRKKKDFFPGEDSTNEKPRALQLL